MSRQSGRPPTRLAKDPAWMGEGLRPSPIRRRSGDLADQREQDEALAVRFPLPANGRRPPNGTLRRLSALLPRRWRRRVVIQGQRFWLPG